MGESSPVGDGRGRPARGAQVGVSGRGWVAGACCRGAWLGARSRGRSPGTRCRGRLPQYRGRRPWSEWRPLSGRSEIGRAAALSGGSAMDRVAAIVRVVALAAAVATVGAVGGPISPRRAVLRFWPNGQYQSGGRRKRETRSLRLWCWPSLRPRSPRRFCSGV